MKDSRFENRYLTLKKADIENFLSPKEQQCLTQLVVKINAYRYANGKQPLEGLFIGADWPEYQDASEALAGRIATGKVVPGSLMKLRALCGCVENGTDICVEIGQDDATKSWSVSGWNMGDRLWYETDEHSLAIAITKAYDAHGEKS